MSNVRYDKALRESAKNKRLFLVTVAVDGREIGDDSCTVQRLADVKMAKRICRLALDLMKKGRGDPPKGAGKQ